MYNELFKPIASSTKYMSEVGRFKFPYPINIYISIINKNTIIGGAIFICDLADINFNAVIIHNKITARSIIWKNILLLTIEITGRYPHNITK
jgi:hypothetical protein